MYSTFYVLHKVFCGSRTENLTGTEDITSPKSDSNPKNNHNPKPSSNPIQELCSQSALGFHSLTVFYIVRDLNILHSV